MLVCEGVVRTILIIHQSFEAFDEIVFAIKIFVTRGTCCRGRTLNLSTVDLSEDVGQGYLALRFDERLDPATASQLGAFSSMNVYELRNSRYMAYMGKTSRVPKTVDEEYRAHFARES